MLILLVATSATLNSYAALYRRRCLPRFRILLLLSMWASFWGITHIKSNPSVIERI